ncbi:hypothetical protein HPP92_008649 [Vanilla planifolia]|uniref:BHLH domain-containing protein n=1 Tax=Vanilla planifolia TaxID=51239 RepID=A0A835RCS5_VANPL|nr:hypothetical protein HPP92_008832 [Vanilla planifolia]KAG0486554.1 hypothetical protein HPP92_008649 [Vanilla planifolia]
MMSSPSTSAAGREKAKSTRKPPPESKWRSGVQQRIYGRRLIEALRATSYGGGQHPPPTAGPRAIKDAADSALALTARGQSRWSRAILFGRCRRRKLLIKAGGKIRRQRSRRPLRKITLEAIPDIPEEMHGKKMRDRLRKLSMLVPGCRKLSATSLLEEAADYVAALEMQVKTMRALADALSAAAISPPSPIPSGFEEDRES